MTVMVLEYTWGIFTTLISFEYSNALQISLAIFTIVITSILSLRFRSRTKYQRQKEDKIENDVDDEIGLQACFKQAQHKLIEKKLNLEDPNKEKERESQTLIKVMKLLQERKDLFPESSLDDLKQQLNLYRTK